MNVSALVLVVVLGGAAVLAWRSRVRGYALGFGVCALLPGWALVSSLTWPFALAGGALMVGLVWQRWTSSQARMGRWSTRARRWSGLASPWTIARFGGVFAVRRLTRRVRPRLAAEVGLFVRWFLLPTTEMGVELARVGVQRLWCSAEQVVVIVGGPRMGKTGWLAARINDAPGAVVVTSTRTDVIGLCGPVRAATRGPVYVFNAAGLGGLASTITFDPLTGCDQPDIAQERAEDMVRGGDKTASGGGDRAHWQSLASEVLAAFLHAAALAPGRTIHDVLAWTADVALCSKEVPGLLSRSTVRAFETAVTQFVTTNDRTRTSITSSMKPALRWLMRPSAVAAAAPAAVSGRGFDVERVLAERATVFLIGAEEADTTPLMLALTGYIARTARRIAADAGHPLSREGRLDPPLTLALDECALIAPIPLPSWSADMGGRGVTIIAAFQSHAQVVSRYGVHDAAVIFDNCGGSLLFGGTADEADLRWWAARAGDRDEITTTTDAAGKTVSRSVRRVPVFTASQIANLRPGQVIVWRAGVSASIGWTRMAWRRRDVRAITRGWPAATAAAGLLGAAAYTAHRPTIRALLGLDRRLGAAVAAVTIRPLEAVARPAATTMWLRAGTAALTVRAVLDPQARARLAARLQSSLLAMWRVAVERVRFTARRQRPAHQPRDTRSRRPRAERDEDAAEFFRTAAAPGPLHGHLIDRDLDGDPNGDLGRAGSTVWNVPGTPPLRPLRVVSHRAPNPSLERPNQHGDEHQRGEHQRGQHGGGQPAGAWDREVDPPTGPIDLSRLHASGLPGEEGGEDGGGDGGSGPAGDGRWTA